VKSFPSIPRLADAPPELLSGGHLWILEKLDGANVRFALADTGQVVFGDRSRVYDGALPEPYRHAARHVRVSLDRGALREAVSDPTAFVFFGEAMHRHAIDYDWERTPSFLGFDVWSAAHERFLPPDAVERAFERVGLEPANAFAKEVPAQHFEPASYELPRSAWYDGPAEGVVLRSKTGLRAKLLHPDFREVDDAVPVETTDPGELAARYATDRRIEKSVAKLEDHERPVEFDRVYERVLEDVVREEHKRLFHGDRSVDMRAFRSAIAERVRRYLDEREE
jgi:hypothetical protein